MAQKIFIQILLVLSVMLKVTICDYDNVTAIGGSNTEESVDELIDCVRKNCPIERFNEDGSREIHLAILMPMRSQTADGQTLSSILPAIELAIESVHKQTHLSNYKFVMHPRDTDCSSTIGPIQAFHLHQEGHDDVYLGPICDYALAPVARYAGYWQKPVISTGGLAPSFAIKTPYFPTLIRMLSYSEMTNAIIKILAHFKWGIFGFFFYNYDDKLKGHSPCNLIVAPINHHYNNRSNVYETFEDPSYSQLKEKLNKLKQKSRIIIMCANPSTIREIMIAAEELSMIDSGEYAFFNIEIFASLEKDSKPWYNENEDPSRNEMARKAYQALLTITSRKPEEQEYQNFSEKVKLLAKEKYNYTFDDNEPVSQFVSAFHDAVLLFADALKDSIAKNGNKTLTKPLNGTELTQLMWNRNFTGITGNVSIDSNGDRLSDYSLLDMNPNTSHFEIVAHFYHASGLKFIEGKTIHWAGGRTEPPADRPKCGFDNSLCPEDSSTMFAILSLVLSIVVIIMAIVSFISYRHYKLEAEISSMTWKINWNEVIPVPTFNQIRGSFHSRAGSQLSVYSEELMGDRQVYIPIASYKGNTVAIKKIHVPINLTRSLMMELKSMKDIQHDHLVRFYGAVIDCVPCILTEYCPKGSLEDILENHEINLDLMFKLSLMHDLVKGMHYLHTTPIHSHGQLKSSNCVVDSRFVLKITDFGLHDLRKSQDDEENKDSYEYWKKYLWTAPELLRANDCSGRGTQKGDVYSFAIIVQEICCRQGVFYLGNRCIEKSPKEIVDLVSTTPIYPSDPFRPAIDEGKESCCDVNSLMVKCWSDDPDMRPDFACIKSMIRKINKQNESGNILDNLLKRMEHYAQNLEALVDERTLKYLEEKKKCEELLYQLLPVSIASQLINGQTVIAEMYDQVTIYFSDIVGFTSISAESTPMQVVDLLNDLYTCFDKIVGNFDVYKVETIGDAYLVVSGLPVRNGNLHAREISRMALALLAKVHSFVIRHRPEDKLKLRIGLHSGPCCAGVVGLKMPRYCLFGDTVNTASRMETNGEPLKIHISHSTKTILDKFGTFDVTTRGYVSMKGKGEMLTYWLNGERTQEDQKKISSSPSLPAIESIHLNNNNNNISTQNNHQNHDKDVKFADSHALDERPKAIVQPLTLTPQNSFNSRKNLMINSSLRSNLNSCGSLKDLSNQPLLNGKKGSFFKKKQINFNNEKLQPLLSTIK